MADGPMGVRSWAGSSAITNSSTNPVRVETTSFPSGVAMASTWDTALVQREGQAIAQEVKALGRDMILGPTVNINRVPLWGRNFEGYGEDPYLAGQLGVAYIQGVQGEGVIPSVKHFDANNEEFERHRSTRKSTSARCTKSICPPLKPPCSKPMSGPSCRPTTRSTANTAPRIPTCSPTCSRRNSASKALSSPTGAAPIPPRPPSTQAWISKCPADRPPKAMLKSPRTIMSGNSGLWLEADKVLADVKAGKITEATIDDNVGRILRVILVSGIMDHPHTATGEVDTPAQQQVARQGETEGIVLLKNQNNLLPLDASKIHSIAVIGPNALVARTGGGGSSLVRPKYAISPLQGIREARRHRNRNHLRARRRHGRRRPRP